MRPRQRRRRRRRRNGERCGESRRAIGLRRTSVGVPLNGWPGRQIGIGIAIEIEIGFLYRHRNRRRQRDTDVTRPRLLIGFSLALARRFLAWYRNLDWLWTGFHPISMGCPGFYWVLPGFESGLYRVFRGV